MTNKRARIILSTVLAVILVVFLFEKFVPGISSKQATNESFELLGKIIQLVRSHYIEEPKPASTMKGALKGLVDSLDTLSCYLDRESVLRYSSHKEPRLYDIGVILYKNYGSFPQVIGIIEKSPAEKSGMQLGDIISSLDDRPTRMMSLIETHLYLKDRNPKTVKLRILRGRDTKELTVERTILFKAPFSFQSAKGTNGILTIHGLYPSCVEKIKDEVISKIESTKSPLILDLRNCYEGDVGEARKLINLFLQSPQIGYFAKKGKHRNYLDCLDKAELERLPLIVWTNQATVGPAEIVAAVLKEFKRAKIIGLPTPGLAARQDFFPLEDGSGLLLTSEIFFLSSGERIWGNGVKPDVSIKLKDQNLNSYLKKSFTT